MPETIVNCPICEKEVIWNKESKYRPFCSERCQIIDLGDWAAEKHAIASEEAELFSEDLEKY